LEVYVSQDGHSRALDAAEQVELDDRVRAARCSFGEGERSTS
jgi:hypothetical protein